MTLQQLQLFVASLEEGSFSAAAERLHMAQPSVSEQVRRLEAELGVELFRRVGRGLVVTEAGRTLRPHAQRTLASAEEARTSVSEIRELRGGTAAFGTFGSSHLYLGPELIMAFRRAHPLVRVRLLGQNSSDVVQAVRSGELEAGLVVLPVDDRELDVTPIVSDEVLFLSSDPALLKRPMTIERLAATPLVLSDAHWGQSDPTRRRLAELAQRAGVSIEPEIDVEDPDAALTLVADGLGSTIIERAALYAQRTWVPENVGWVPFAEPLMQDFAFVWRRHAHLSPATRAFVALAEERLRAFMQEVADAPRRWGPPAGAPK